MGGSTAGASASSGSQNGTKTDTIDAETKAFRDKLFGVYGDMTKNIPGFGGDNSATFIAPESQDTKSYYDAIRGMQGQGNPNSAGINTFGQGLMANGGITGGDVQSGNAYMGRVGVGGMTPAFLDYMGGYDPAQAGKVGSARDLTGAATSSPYMSQYLSGVIDPTLAEFDNQSAVGRQANRSGRGSDTAFGNRASNADAVYQAQSDRDRALLSSGLRKDAFTTATGYGMTDADRLVANDRQAQALEAQRLEANAGRTDSASRYAMDQKYGVNQGNVGINNAAQQFNIGNAVDQAKYNNDADYRTQVDNLTRSNAVQEGNINRGIGVQQQNIGNQVTGAGILSGQDQNDFQRTLTSLGLLGQSGTDQNNFNQRKASEPLDLLGMASSIIAGVPYGSTTTNQQKSKSKSSGLSVGGGG